MKHVRTAALWPLLAVLAVFVMASSGPQCARTSDVFEPAPPQSELDDQGYLDPCVLGCWAEWFSDVVAESRRYRKARAACNWDWDCLLAERSIHLSILANLKSERVYCVDACEHEQGSGVGGQ